MVLINGKYFDRVPTHTTSCKGCYFAWKGQACPPSNKGTLLCTSKELEIIFKENFIIPMIKELLGDTK